MTQWRFCAFRQRLRSTLLGCCVFVCTSALAQQAAVTSPRTLADLTAAAETGDRVAQFQLGLAYDEARNGATQDSAKALVWYRKSAEQGYAPAEANLAYMYENGAGVTQDYKEAFAWYT